MNERPSQPIVFIYRSTEEFANEANGMVWRNHSATTNTAACPKVAWTTPLSVQQLCETGSGAISFPQTHSHTDKHGIAVAPGLTRFLLPLLVVGVGVEEFGEGPLPPQQLWV